MCPLVEENEDIPIYEYALGTKQDIAKNIEAYIKNNSIEMRVALLHSLAHIEFNAMKSYMDTLLRFFSNFDIKESNRQAEFIEDIVRKKK